MIEIEDLVMKNTTKNDFIKTLTKRNDKLNEAKELFESFLKNYPDKTIFRNKVKNYLERLDKK